MNATIRPSMSTNPKFVSQETELHKVFDPIFAKQTKGEQDFILILAAILANAMRRVQKG